MHSLSATKIIAIFMMVVVAISAAGVSSVAKGKCLVDVPVFAIHAVDSYCVKSSLVEEAAEYVETSCSPYASVGASTISGNIPIHTPNWLISKPYLQLLSKRLDKPPRVPLLF